MQKARNSARSASPMRNCSTRARGSTEAADRRRSAPQPAAGERKPDRRRAFLRSGSHRPPARPPDRPGRKGGRQPRRAGYKPARDAASRRRTTSTPPTPTRPAKSSAGSRTCSAQSSRSPSATPGSPATRTPTAPCRNASSAASRKPNAAQAEADAREEEQIAREYYDLWHAWRTQAQAWQEVEAPLVGGTRRNSGSCGMAAPSPLTSTAI